MRRAKFAAAQLAVIVAIEFLQGIGRLGDFLSRDLTVVIGVERELEWMVRWWRRWTIAARGTIRRASIGRGGIVISHQRRADANGQQPGQH
jgi:hypothetical protein